MWGIIATWRMAEEAVTQGAQLLAANGTAGDAIEEAIAAVEDFPFYKSVGYGGLPNEHMEVELDAAFMDGTTLDMGGVAAIKDVANPIRVARKLSREHTNSLLVGAGAEQYAHINGFERKNMLTDRAKIHYNNRIKELTQTELTPYSGHDTVGMVTLDTHRNVVAATSTSGLFMKKKGRVGDSPLCGSGLYADSEVGGATATGLGEDLMKGCISYEVVRLMKEGLSPQEACDQAILHLHTELVARRGKAGDMAVVAMNNNGEWGAGTNANEFSFAVATAHEAPRVYIANPVEGRAVIEPASQEWLDAYMASRMAPLEEL